jgi:hypothetical protein
MNHKTRHINLEQKDFISLLLNALQTCSSQNHEAVMKAHVHRSVQQNRESRYKLLQLQSPHF